MKTSVFPTATTMTAALLMWWEESGRRDPAQKPWMFTLDARWPVPDEHLSVYGCWIAEVMLCSAA